MHTPDARRPPDGPRGPGGPMPDEELCYRAALSEDSRFDGLLYIGVASTGIYCRPTCPAMTPKRVNMRFFRTSAAAQAAGFRACKRCRPDATPGSPEWNSRADLAGRAMRLIADGLVDREGVSGLAARLNYSERQLQRQLVAEVGAGPLALARAQRARTAQMLLETTDLLVSEVAFAAGYSSIRQFNENMRAVFALTPTELRTRAAPRRPRTGAAPQPWGSGVVLRLPYRTPLDLPALLAHLGAQAVPGVEEYADGVYRRSLVLPHGTAVVGVSPDAVDGPAVDAAKGARRARRSGADDQRGFVRCELHLRDLRDLAVAVQRCRRLLDLDADPRAVDEVLAQDPLLAPLVARAPGRRVPGCADPAEYAVRAVLGQGVPRERARRDAARLVERYGTPLARQTGRITHTFPTAASLAERAPADLAEPVDRAGTDARGQVLRGLATALTAGDVFLDPGADRDEATRELLKVEGLWPHTAARIRMRALGDPDVFLPVDLGSRAAHRRPPLTEHRAEAWRPWRSYALQYLWAGRQDV